MFKKAKKLLLYGILVSALGYVAFTGGFLQEFSSDDIPDLARQAGLTLPLRDPWLEADLSKMTLSLHDGETTVARYNLGFGERVPGRVTDREGSTPLGEFQIVRKERRKNLLERGSRFLVIDFPDEDYAGRALELGVIGDDDYRRIMKALEMGEPPPTDTPLGGPIGIQGNFFPIQNRRFTDGSLALSNADINELYEHVTVGTPLIIKDR